MVLMSLKLFKYCITIVPSLPEQPTFTDYFVSDLINTAKIHATHRFLIQARQSEKIYTLVSPMVLFYIYIYSCLKLDLVI